MTVLLTVHNPKVALAQLPNSQWPRLTPTAAINGTAAIAASFETVIWHRHRLSDDRWRSPSTSGVRIFKFRVRRIPHPQVLDPRMPDGPHPQTSRWGVGPCQLSSDDSIHDLTLQTTNDLLTPAVLMTCTALVHATRACSCMVCFSAGYILPELLKFICTKWSFGPRSIRVCRKNCGSESAVDRSPHYTAIHPDDSAAVKTYLRLTCSMHF